MSCSVRDERDKLLASSCFIESEVKSIAGIMGLDAKQDGQRLLGHLHEKFRTVPGEEDRWLDGISDQRLASNLLHRAFRPLHPVEWKMNPRLWLSDLDIDLVLSQYHTNLGDSHRFKFAGVFPSDFADTMPGSGRCVSPKMCDLSVRDLLRSGTHYTGIVFNMDKHNQRGSHWVACYVGLDPSTPERFGAFYYDSSGKKPPESIHQFMLRMQSEAEQEGLNAPRIPFQVHYNAIRKQFKTTECGIYAILFIILCLQTDLAFGDLCQNIISNDDSVHDLRWKMFRSPR